MSGIDDPYFAAPNTELQAIAQSIEVAASPDEVWSLIGDFGGAWHPLTARVGVTGTGIGQLRHRDARRQRNRRATRGDRQREAVLRYTSIAGMPVSHYTGTLEVKPNGSGSVVDWRTQFVAHLHTDRAAKVLVSTLLNTGLESLKSRFGGTP